MGVNYNNCTICDETVADCGDGLYSATLYLKNDDIDLCLCYGCLQTYKGGLATLGDEGFVLRRNDTGRNLLTALTHAEEHEVRYHTSLLDTLKTAADTPGVLLTDEEIAEQRVDEGYTSWESDAEAYINRVGSRDLVDLTKKAGAKRRLERGDEPTSAAKRARGGDDSDSEESVGTADEKPDDEEEDKENEPIAATQRPLSPEL
jgi:hypothetical protein